METEILRQAPAQIDSDCLVIVAFEETPPVLDPGIDGWLRELYDSGEFKGRFLDMALAHRPSGLRAARLLVLGGGKKSSFTPAEMRKAAGAAVRTLKSKSVRRIAILLDREFHSEDHVSAAAEGAILGNFDSDRYKSDSGKNGKRAERIAIVATDAAPSLDRALERGRILAESQNFARELVSEPANRMSPTVLAERARLMACEQGLECEILDRDRMRQLGMGALLGVAQGSAEPPALIVVRYRPSEQPQADAHLGLIGKGVTFDTGGISIKPSDGMEKMKYDMAGGAAVLGAMRAIARLMPAIPVTALVPAVENMPGSRAQRPGDIVTSLSGKTIEVLNTDAEGRLILADAITYAQRLGCTHLVDAATLTGAVVVALGHVNVGAFGNRQDFLDRLLAAARTEGEKMWPMPLDDEYKDYLKSAFADIPNIGGRWGGAITAATFLKEFAGDTPWVHLDIAGTAWLDEAKPFLAKGASGVCVRTFTRLATHWQP